MKIESEWYVIFEGSGSVSGNGWLEEVCYLGQEQWLLSLRDDPAWSVSEVQVQEPEEYSSEGLATWVIDIDSMEEDKEYRRVNALLDISADVGALECEARLRRFIQDRS